MTLAPPAAEAAVRTAKFEYLFVPITGATQAKFGEILKDHEGRGWEYAGTTPLADPKRDVWVFRRPVPALALTYIQTGDATYSAAPTTTLSYQAVADHPMRGTLAAPTPTAEAKPTPKPIEAVRATKGELAKPAPAIELTASSGTLTLSAPATDDAEGIQQQIKDLQARLVALKTAPPQKVAFNKSSTALQPAELASVLASLGREKFGTSGKFNVSVTNGGVTVSGDQEVIDWANALVRRLKGN